MSPGDHMIFALSSPKRRAKWFFVSRNGFLRKRQFHINDEDRWVSPKSYMNTQSICRPHGKSILLRVEFESVMLKSGVGSPAVPRASVTLSSRGNTPYRRKAFGYRCPFRRIYANPLQGCMLAIRTSSFASPGSAFKCAHPHVCISYHADTKHPYRQQTEV